MIPIRFNIDLLLDPWELVVKRVRKGVVPLSIRKIRAQDVGRRREFDSLLEEFDKEHERKKIEKIEYNAKKDEALKKDPVYQLNCALSILKGMTVRDLLSETVMGIRQEMDEYCGEKTIIEKYEGIYYDPVKHKIFIKRKKRHWWETEEGKATLLELLNKEYHFNKDGTITRRDGEAMKIEECKIQDAMMVNLLNASPSCPDLNDTTIIAIDANGNGYSAKDLAEG